MAKKLCVKINMFDANQQIFIAKDDEIKYIASAPMDRISELAYSLAGEREVDEIEVDGNPDFIQQIGMEILEGLEKFYSDKNVRVKLNGEIFN